MFPHFLRGLSAVLAPDGARSLTGTVVTRESLGSDLFVFADLRPSGEASGLQGLALVEDRAADSSRIRAEGRIVARFPAGSAVTEGERIGLAVAPNSLHLFDPETGMAWARARAQAPEPDLAGSAPGGPGNDRAR